MLTFPTRAVYFDPRLLFSFYRVLACFIAVDHDVSDPTAGFGIGLLTESGCGIICSRPEAFQKLLEFQKSQLN